jgi:hypothetical protein
MQSSSDNIKTMGDRFITEKVLRDDTIDLKVPVAGKTSAPGTSAVPPLWMTSSGWV